MNEKARISPMKDIKLIRLLLLVFSLIITNIISNPTNFEKTIEDSQNELYLNNQEIKPIQKKTSEELKKKAKWQSYEWEKNPFKDHTFSQLKKLISLDSLLINENNLLFLIDDDDHTLENTLPRNFDSRKIWPDCLGEVRDQVSCGSCWAFSASDVLSDRFCIASSSKNKTILSPQDMISCDKSNNGCEGGELDKAWKYLENYGIVDEQCFPYQSGDGTTIPNCRNDTCIDSNYTFKKYKAKMNSSKAYQCPTMIKMEIFARGPIQAGFFVYEDFMHYESGIYEYTHGRKIGGHAVKIIGWGEENESPYWIVQNSWGNKWGEDGFFRIKMGECMIDRNGYAGNANLEEINSFSRSKGFLEKEFFQR
jgi:cathepsin B